MTHRLTTNYAKNYCNRTLIVKVIVENVVTCFFGTQCRVGFSGTADRTALFTVRTNPRWRPPPCWQNFKWRYLRNRSSFPLHVWL